MAEKSKEKKRSGNATLIATAIALMVSGTALWSINRSISIPESTGTGMFPADTLSKDPSATKATPEAQATLTVMPPPVQDLPSADNRMPALSPTPVEAEPAPTAEAEDKAPSADTAAIEVSPETNMPAEQDTADMSQAETLATVIPAAGSNTDKPNTATVAMADPGPAAEDEGVMKKTAAAGGASYYIAIGSYLRHDNALLVQRQRQSWHPQIRDAIVEGRHFYRLVVGPFAFKDLAAARTRMRKAGVVGEWPVRAGRGTERADLALLDG